MVPINQPYHHEQTQPLSFRATAEESQRFLATNLPTTNKHSLVIPSDSRGIPTVPINQPSHHEQTQPCHSERQPRNPNGAGGATLGHGNDGSPYGWDSSTRSE